MNNPRIHPETAPADLTTETTHPCKRYAPNGDYRCGLEAGHGGSHAYGYGTYTRAIWSGAGADWHAWPNP